MTNFAYRAEGLARLSNGLRTPLALIVGYADLLALEPDAGEIAETAHRIRDAAVELTRIVDDLLAVNAIDTGVLFLSPAPTQVSDVVREAVAAAGERGIAFTVDVEDGAASSLVSADLEQAATMVTTLLENARLRTANAGATLRVRRGSWAIAFEVSDGGGALDEGDTRAAFDAFSSVIPRTGLTTGLELYKVRRLAELHLGRVWAANGDGGEALFGFALPLAASS
jgi:K+-sensing histidine kinase KdpD